MELKGTIIRIFDEVQVSDKFKKREFVLKTDGQYPQSILIQTTQAKCMLLDTFVVGDNVVVNINIRGREYIKGTDVKYFNSIEAWKISDDVNQEQGNGHEGHDAPANGQDEDDLPF